MNSEAKAYYSVLYEELYMYMYIYACMYLSREGCKSLKISETKSGREGVHKEE